MRKLLDGVLEGPSEGESDGRPGIWARPNFTVVVDQNALEVVEALELLSGGLLASAMMSANPLENHDCISQESVKCESKSPNVHEG